MSTQKVSYRFDQNAIKVDIVISSSSSNYTASDGKTYEGYAVISGQGQYTANGIPMTFQIAPQTTNPYNVLWAFRGMGSGGNSYGIDSYGLALLGDNGNLAWNGAKEGPNSFWLSITAFNSAITLDAGPTWPPRN
jgi:hypothetical protein